jgi:uncharacterized membrane protein YfcA
MALIEFLLFVLVGCVVGFLAGLFGVGGGFVMVPILIFSYEHLGVASAVMTHIVIGTSLFVVVFASFTSAYQHRKQGNIDWRSVYMIGFSSALTALAATRLAAALSGKQLQIAVAIIFLTGAVRMITESKAQSQKRLEFSVKPGAAPLIGLGVTAGIVSALAGIGGGLYTIPIMYYILKMPLKLAIGTSSATIVITALFSVTGYILNGLGHPELPEWSLGFVDLRSGIALAIGSLFLARVGAWVSFKTDPYVLRRLFALFVIVISVYIVLR